MRIKKIKIDKTKILKLLKVLPYSIASHAFFASLILFLIALLIGTILFYKYFILTQKTDISDTEDSYLLDEEGYEELKNTWQKHEMMLNQSDSEEYPNPFINSISFPVPGQND